MLYLVATEETQGQRQNDFCFVAEGEIVRFDWACDRDGDNPDGACGCARAMSGTKSAKATTTMKVVELDMPREQIERIIAEAYRESYGDMEFDFVQLGADEVSRIASICGELPEGTVVEKRGVDIQARLIKDTDKHA